MSSHGKNSRKKKAGAKQNTNEHVENKQPDNQASTEPVSTDTPTTQEDGQATVQPVDESEKPELEEAKALEEKPEETKPDEDQVSHDHGEEESPKDENADEGMTQKEEEASTENQDLAKTEPEKPATKEPAEEKTEEKQPEDDKPQLEAASDVENEPKAADEKPSEKDLEIPSLAAFGSKNAKPKETAKASAAAPKEKTPQNTAEQAKPSSSKAEAKPAPSAKDAPKKPITRAERKIEKRRLRDEDYDRMAAIPRSNIFSTVFLPAATMRHVSRTKEPNLSQFTCFFANVIKWCAVGAVPAMWLGILINQDAFGTIRLNFTQQTVVDLFVIGFGIAVEYFSYFMLWFYSLLTRRPVSLRKLISVEARSSLSVAVIMALSCFLSKVSIGLSLAIGMVGIFIGVMLKAYGLDLVLKISKTEQILIASVMVIVATMMALTFFPMVNGEITEILLRLFEI